MGTIAWRMALGSTFGRIVAVGALALAALASGIGSQPVSASRSSPSMTCSGPNSLDGFFRLQGQINVTGKRVGCATARKVAKTFSRTCFDAYAGQGDCTVRASGRWRCHSRIVGSLSEGAPSKADCRRRRGRITFEIAYFPPTELFDAGIEPFDAEASARVKGPYDDVRKCIEANHASTVLPPPAGEDHPWELHLLEGIRRETGEELHRTLVKYKVGEKLYLGLKAYPPNWRDSQAPVPLLVTSEMLVTEDTYGMVEPTCANRFEDAILIRTDGPELASLAAHELFHTYSDGIARRGTPWWEEASATWAVGKLGFPEVEEYDPSLQYPDTALDALLPKLHRYAMSRFVQFLDLKGMIDGPNSSWPLQRQVITGYPDATKALDAALAIRGTSVGEQLAAFWGDRLRERPVVASNKQLKPSPPWNARQIEVQTEAKVEPIDAEPLHTRLVDFRLAKRVKRVEFEFDADGEGYFWGLIKPTESRRFFNGEPIAFCVGGAYGDALSWPGHLPVTFTSGVLDGDGMTTGTITIFTQTDSDQCQDPNDNRACRALVKAGVGGVMGSPLYPGRSGLGGSKDIEDGRLVVHCVYTGRGGVANLSISRWTSPQEMRRSLGASCKSINAEPLKLGDLACVGSQGEQHAWVGVALGHDNIVVQVSKQSGAPTSAIGLARGVVNEVGP